MALTNSDYYIPNKPGGSVTGNQKVNHMVKPSTEWMWNLQRSIALEREVDFRSPRQENVNQVYTKFKKLTQFQK